MITKIIKIYFTAILVVSISTFWVDAQNESQEKILEMFYSAEELYLRGKYEQSRKELSNILSLSPEHKESSILSAKCKEKIDLTADLISEAVDGYMKGLLDTAVKKLESALKKDENNFKVKTLLIKITTELGMESSIFGNHNKALKYLKKAQKLSPDNKEIIDLIKISE